MALHLENISTHITSFPYHISFLFPGVGAFAARWQAMRAAALRTAESYWRVSRNTRPDVRIVAAGLEPQRFTDLFDDWCEHDEAADANIAVSFY